MALAELYGLTVLDKPMFMVIFDDSVRKQVNDATIFYRPSAT